MRICLWTAILLFGAAAPVAAQQNPSDAAKTGSVAGVVVDEKSGGGVAKAVVILRRDPESGIGAITGPDGKFTVRDIDPGTYEVAIERDGYVVAGGQSPTVEVQAGGAISDLKLKLLRTSAISGRILDADGDPIAGVSVVVTATRARKDTRPGNGYATTNDRGEYRIFHIAPGEYRLSATYAPRSRFDGVRMQPPAKPDAASGSEAYPTIYYPGAMNAREAAVVKLEPGAELQGFDVQLVRAHGVRVRGRVTVSSGSPTPLFRMIGLVQIGERDSSRQTHDLLIRDPNGEFEFENVLPGKYRLQVEVGGFDDLNRMSARRTLEVGSSDIAGIELTAEIMRPLSGRVIVPEGRKLPTGLLVVLASREAGDTQGGGVAQVGADGAFKIPPVAPGEYDIVVGSATGGGDDSYIQAIRMGETDALAEGVHIGDRPAPPLEIVLKPNGAAAECSVKDDKGNPVPGASILIAPDPPRERQAALFGECRTRADGTCKIAGIAPGEYHVYAFPAGMAIDHRDLDALKPFEKYSEAIKVAEGERKTVNLKTAPAE